MCGKLKDTIKTTDENILVWVSKKPRSYRGKNYCYSITNETRWDFGVMKTDRKSTNSREKGSYIAGGMFHSFKSRRAARKLSNYYRYETYPAVVPKGSTFAPITNCNTWDIIEGTHGYASKQLIVFKNLQDANKYLENN